MEDDYLIDAVQKFRLKVLLERFFDVGLDFPVGPGFLGQLLNLLACDIAGHNDNGILEIDGSAFSIGQSTVIEDLQQYVEDVQMRLFNLVQQDYRIGLSSNRFGQSAALFVADIAGRCADKPGNGVLLHKFAHINADHSVRVVEKKISQRL